jgi:hypothetical protein
MIDVEDKVPLSIISKTNPVDPPTARGTHLLTADGDQLELQELWAAKLDGKCDATRNISIIGRCADKMPNY